MVPDWLVYVLLGLLCAGALVALVCWLVSFFRKSPAERKEIVIQFLMGLVTVAEDAVKEHGAGAEKLAMVEEAFNKKAPWVMKLLLKFSGAKDLRELIEDALQRVKGAWGK